MKKLFVTLGVVTTFFLLAFKSDNCESFFPQKIGTKWEMTSYDAKNKVTGSSNSELMSVTNITDGIQATVNVETFDPKGKSMSKGDYTLKCDGQKFYMDMGNMLPKSSPGMEGATIEMTNQYMEFPEDPSAGQTLDDAASTMTMKMNGMTVMTVNITITDRKIEVLEDVTTPAGTFHAVKYSYTTNTKSKMFNKTYKGVSWLAKNIGMVKTESYDDKGDLQGSTVLTKVN